jgi:cytochrome c peroxidase
MLLNLRWRRLGRMSTRALDRLCDLGTCLIGGLLICSLPSGSVFGAPTADDAAAIAALGKAIFFDPSLSGSGHISCATCHDPAHAYGPPDGAAVRHAGADLQTPGIRAVPSLRYTLNRTPAWSKQYQSSDVERAIETDSVPIGGFGWDGRFDSLREQAAFPLLAANEMGNSDVAAFVAKLARTAYAPPFRALFGAGIFDHPEAAFQAALLAIERFELDDASFHPYSSRFDAFLDGKLELNPAEQRGLRLFSDPRKGNCNACHTAAPGADGSHPLFTDFSFANLGVPRNPEIPANLEPAYFDMGLCGPLRQDQRRQKQWCGMFKTPSLRNVAARRVYFHNGRVHTLLDAVRFYAERDARPERWFSRPDGQVELFTDLPKSLRGNVDHIDGPLNRAPGAPAALTDADVDDIVAFLKTLTDADLKP